MKCRDVIERLSATVDGQIREAEANELRQHLRRCPECELRAHQFNSLRGTLRSIPAPKPPATLTTQLRVIASRERALQLRRLSFHNAFSYWSAVVRVWSRNLMRPFALPAAGGLLSAVFLFSILAPMYPAGATSIGSDVPLSTLLSTRAALKQSSISFGLIKQEIVVDVLVNGQGRMIEYSVPLGQNWQNDPAFRRCIENTLLCTQFTPATMFGQPRKGRVRISVRGNQVEVKG